MNEELTIFDLLYSKYKISKPIRLIELFGGYGSQALALKYLGVKFTHWKLCEWAVNSIQAYKDIHFENDSKDYSASFNINEIKDFLVTKGISKNYNEPMTKEQIKKMNELTARKIFNNIITTNNLVNIQQVKGKDLEIRDTDKYEYIMTYSFPCQDLSLAGKGKGMSDTSTRSGLLWEVERILGELKEKPQILLMENVPQVHSQDNIEDFKKWILRLEEFGYKNYFQDLIATDYGIPQTRNRCFMVSILGDYSYSFPPKQTLNLKLKNLLEENVDEKYYLSDKMIRYIYSDKNSGKYQRKKARESCDRNIEKGIASTITTSAGNRPTDNFIKIKNATKKGYLEAKEGDGIDISRPNCETRRGRVQKEAMQTLDTMGGNGKGVVVSNTLKKDLCNKLIKEGLVEEGNIVKHSYTQQILEGNKKCVEKSDGNMITLTTRGDCVGICVNDPKIIDDRDKGLNGVNITNVCPTQRASRNGLKVLQNDLRIRKLTPKECFRLMGVRDEDFEKCASNQSDISLYHLAGDSIVVNVLMAIFKQFL